MASASASAGGYRRVLLVGFMGSGKSTVGALLASRLGWSFLDFDDEIERRVGSSVEEIFRTEGEPFFRAVEAEVGRELLELDRAVLATGGGWAAAVGRMESLGSDTLSVWLDVGVGTALERARAGERVRPLLQTDDPELTAEALLAERARYYGGARLHLDATGPSPRELVEEIVGYMNSAAPEAE